MDLGTFYVGIMCFCGGCLVGGLIAWFAATSHIQGKLLDKQSDTEKPNQ
jgi:hypothetical protein